jgi:hypothetical protein
MSDAEGNRPIPDPTELTTDALRREIGAVKELLRSEVTGMVNVVNEKFVGVTQRLDMAESWRQEQKTDTRAALTDALSAAKELGAVHAAASEKAINKSEETTVKQLENLAAMVRALEKSLDEKIAALTATVSAAQAVLQ